jgi:predicted PurR-regulated permease PerM
MAAAHPPAKQCRPAATGLAGQRESGQEAPGLAKGQKMADRQIRVEEALAFVVLAVIAAGCFLVLRPFLSAILWAMIFCAATWRPFQWLAGRIGNSQAALLLTISTALLTLVPLGLLTARGAGEFSALQEQVEQLRAQGLPALPGWITGIPLIGGPLGETYDRISTDLGGVASMLRPYAGDLAGAGLAIVLGFANGLLELLLALLVAFFFFRDGEQLGAAVRRGVQRLTPRGESLLQVATGTVRSVVLGIVGTAIVQGVLAAIGIAIAGVPGPVLLGFLTALGSPFPVLPVLPWLGGVIFLFIQGDNAWAIFLALWGVLGVSSADNFVRPWLISLGSPLPILLILLGVLGGVVAFGFLGLFLGPTLLAVGHALISEWVEAQRQQPPRPPTESV